METNLKQLLNNNVEYNSLETNYTVPISDNSIRNNLLIYSKDNIGSCLRRHSTEIFNNYERSIKDLMCSESFFINSDAIYKPVDSGNPDNPKGYYIENQNYEELRMDLHEMKDLVEPSVKYITGGRGIGKTLTMNVLLYRNFDFLCKNKIVFVRCDIKKYLDLKLKERTLDGKEEFSIADYIDCQFLYVLCEQLDLPFYQEILTILEGKTYDYLESKDFTNDNPQFRNLSIVVQLQRYKSLIKDYQRSHNDADNNYARQVIIKSRLLAPYEGSTRAYANWINLSKKVQLILKDNNYKFWAIIDGIDNINRYDNKGNTQKNFESMIKAVISFRQDKEGRYFIWFLLRNNTYQIIRSQIKSLGSHQLIREDDRFKFSIDIVNKEEVIKERFRVFNVRKEYLKNIDLPEDIDNLYNIYIQEKLIKKSHHIRNYIFNWINFLFWHALYHKKYKSLNFSENFFYSNLILNERTFLDTQNAILQIKQHSDILFNVFYYNSHSDDISKSGIWHGWCATRIMQFVGSKGNDGIKEKDLILGLSELFSYNVDQVRITFQNLMVFGFIRYKDSDELIMKVTNEGQELIDFIFSHLVILYYCALDTPMPDFCTKEKYITSHNNGMHIKDFAPNCIKTTITFLSFLSFQHNEEMKRLKSKNDLNLSRIFINPMDNSEIASILYKKIMDLSSK